MPINQPSPDEQQSDPFARVRDVAPTGSFPTAYAGVLEYLDPEGHAAYCVMHVGDMPLSTFVGLLELGKTRIIEHFENQREE